MQRAHQSTSAVLEFQLSSRYRFCPQLFFFLKVSVCGQHSFFLKGYLLFQSVNSDVVHVAIWFSSFQIETREASASLFKKKEREISHKLSSGAFTEVDFPFSSLTLASSRVICEVTAEVKNLYPVKEYEPSGF